MGIKGEKMTAHSVISADLLMEKLSSINGLTTKRMFGGHGLFSNGKMFGLIDSKGKCFFKADDTNRPQMQEKGAVQHSRMPYYSIPDEIYNNQDTLLEWAKRSVKLVK